MCLEYMLYPMFYPSNISTSWKEAKFLFEEADDDLRMVLSKTMFEGTPEELRPTFLAQPAIVAHALAVIAILKVRSQHLSTDTDST